MCQRGERIVLWIAGGEDVSAEPKLTRCVGNCLAAVVSLAHIPHIWNILPYFLLLENSK